MSERKLTRAYLEAVRDCKPEDCGDCILKPQTNRACHMVDVDPRDEAALALRLAEALEALVGPMEQYPWAHSGEGLLLAKRQAARSLLVELEG